MIETGRWSCGFRVSERILDSFEGLTEETSFDPGT